MSASVYCIEHEEMTHMECEELCGHIHFVPVYDDGGVPIGVDVEFCTYDLGFAFVAPPPDLPEGWQDELQEPGEEVLEPKLEVLLPEMVEA
jgi:hypothetical protein